MLIKQYPVLFCCNLIILTIFSLNEKMKLWVGLEPLSIESVSNCIILILSTNSLNVCSFLLQARIKKIMQTDEEIGKVAAAVPVIICIFSRKLTHGITY